VLEKVPRKEEKRWRRVGSIQQKLARAWHNGLSGAPGWFGANWALSGISGATWLKFTRLSGESSAPAPKYIGDELVALGKSPRTSRLKITGLSSESEPLEPTVTSAICGRRVARANSRLGTPDCPVCTRQCPVRQPVLRPNGRLRPIWKEIAHRTATIVVRWCTGLSSAPLNRRQQLPSKLISNSS
jgi:hypothetical protein